MKVNERANPLLKTLDYFVGIPLLFLLSCFFRRHQKPPIEILRIACLKSAAIGDTVLVSAVLRDLKGHFPTAQLTLFTGSSNFQAAQLISGADQVIKLPMSNPWGAMQIVRQQSFDLFLDFDSWPRINALLTLLSRSKFTLGFLTQGQGRASAYDQTVQHRDDVHELENYRNLARFLGIMAFQDPKINLLSQRKSDPPFVVFHAWPGGAQANKKLWNQQNWLDMAKRIHQRGLQVILSSGPLDVEKSQQLKSLAPELFEVRQPSSLKELLVLLGQARAVLSVDTGIAHLAGALGVPTVVLYGPTSPKRWGALGKNVICLKDDQEVSINFGFEDVAQSTVGVRLSPDEVFSALSLLLEPHFK